MKRLFIISLKTNFTDLLASGVAFKEFILISISTMFSIIFQFYLKFESHEVNLLI